MLSPTHDYECQLINLANPETDLLNETNRSAFRHLLPYPQAQSSASKSALLPRKNAFYEKEAPACRVGPNKDEANDQKVTDESIAVRSHWLPVQAFSAGN